MKSEGRRTHQGGPSYLGSRGGRSKNEQKGKDKGHQVLSKGPVERTHEDATPSQHLWVGNISSAVTETMLAEQFSRFGDIENLKLYPSKSYAFVSLKTVEDALYAKKRLHGAVLGGLAMRIEFAKGDSRRNDQLNLDKKSVEAVFANKEQLAEESSNRGKQEAAGAHPGNKQPAQPKGNKSGEPSEVLWIGFPLHLRIDERKLQDLFNPFGGVEKVSTFPGRTYAFVRFQSVRAAARAKDALQGKLFNDPGVSISFAKSDVGPVGHSPVKSNVFPIPALNTQPEPTPYFPAETATDSNMLVSSSSPVMKLQANRYPSACPPKSGMFPPMFSASTYENSLSRRDEQSQHSNMSGWMNAYREGRLVEDSHLHGKKQENEVGFLAKRSQDSGQRQSSVLDETWGKDEESDGNKREQKRPRFENEHRSGNAWGKLDSSVTRLVDNESYRGKTYPDFPEHDNEYGIKKTSFPFPGQNKGFPGRTPLLTSVEAIAATPEVLEAWSDPLEDLPQKTVPSEPKPDRPVDLGNQQMQVGGPSSAPVKSMFRWEGIIAKGGTHICHCRCLPASKEINVTFPDILNCTARTSLDMLASYISHVSDFSLVLFMPRGGADVAPYQELTAFLAEKKRAAVCRLPEERTLFLVPPTDFVEKFLKVPKSNNILGVVLGQEQLQIQMSQDTTMGLEKRGMYVSGSKVLQKPNSQTSQQSPFQPSYYGSSIVDFPTAAGTHAANALSRSKDVLDRYAAMDDDSRGYQTHERKSLLDFEVQENQVQMDSRGKVYQTPGWTDLHGTDVSTGLPPAGKLLSDQDCTTPSERPILPQFSTMTQSCQGPFHDQPWPPPPPPSVMPPTQVGASSATPLHHAFMHGSGPQDSHQHLLPLDRGGQEQGQEQSSSHASTSLASSHPRNLQPPQILDGQASQQPGLLEALVPRGWEESDQRKVVLQRPYTSEEDQKKFQATLELAAVLLQQLQQQSKR